MTPIFNVQDSIAASFKEPIEKNNEKIRVQTPSSSQISRKKFTEDKADTANRVIDRPIIRNGGVVKKPLPTLKSLSKENKKLQRLLQISLAQRSHDKKSESVAANAANIPMSDSSYNSSLGSDLCMNKSLAQDSSKNGA